MAKTTTLKQAKRDVEGKVIKIDGVVQYENIYPQTLTNVVFTEEGDNLIDELFRIENLIPDNFEPLTIKETDKEDIVYDGSVVKEITIPTIPAIPTELPNPNSLTIKQDGEDDIVYDGSVEKEITLSSGGGLDLTELPYLNQVAGVLASVGRYDKLEEAYNSKDNITLNASGVITGYSEPASGYPLDIVLPVGTKDTGDWAWAQRPFKKEIYESLTLPYGIINIGEYIFYKWASNQVLTIPSSVTNIGNYAFSNWTSNNHPLVIPNSITSIGSGVFQNWTSNNHPLVIPNSITSIGQNAFFGWKANNQQLVIPSSVTNIGNDAFSNWTSNNHPLVIPNSITSIGSGAFQGWKANNQQLVIPNSVTTIGYSAFYDWTSNNHPLAIPNSITSIGNAVFQNWKANNQPLTIPNSVTSIDNFAFQYWSANTHPVTIPSSVTSIGKSVFYNWRSATAFIIERTIPATLGTDVFYGSDSTPIYVPDANVDDYKEATGWIAYADRIFPISDRG